jgi:uncharacterized membrane protein
MEPRYPSGTGSIASVRGHPLHPLIIPLPIGFLVAAFIADLAYVITLDSYWAVTAHWLLLAALIGGAVAALFGVIDLMSLRRARTMGIAWAHAIGNVVALALILANYRLRYGAPEDPAMPYGFILSCLTLLIFAITGVLGGELTFRHGIAVSRGVGGAEGLGNEDETPSGRPDIGKS